MIRALASGRVAPALAIELDRLPTESDPALARALALGLLGCTDNAWRALHEGRAVEPSIALAFASALDRPDLADALVLEIATVDDTTSTGRLRWARAAARIRGWESVASTVLPWCEDASTTPDELAVLAELLEQHERGAAVLDVRRRLVRELPDDIEAHAALARELLYRMKLTEAARVAARLEQLAPTDVRGPRIQGAVAVLEKRDAGDHLSRATELDPRDQETMSWQAEALMSTDPDEAEEWGHRAMNHGAHGFPLTVLRTHIEARLGLLGRGPWTGPIAREGLGRHHDDLLGPHVSRWVKHEDAFLSSAQVRLDVTREILDALGGNRTNYPTLVGSRLETIPRGPGPRASSDRALQRLGQASSDAVWLELEQLTERFPHSPHPFCFRGELSLWLGQYELALDDFERAVGVARTRWAFVGLAAAQLYLGDWSSCLAALRECATFPPVEGATTHIYQGEGHRLHGDRGTALSELRVAAKSRPSRISAWMNLALLGDEDAAHAYSQVCERAPALLFYASGGPPPPSLGTEATEVLERCLHLLRGNRSSRLVSFIDDEGSLRVLPRPDRLVDFCRKQQRPWDRREDDTAREIARIITRSSTLPVTLGDLDLRLLTVEPQPRTLDLVFGRESAIARLRMTGSETLLEGRDEFQAQVEVVAVEQLTERDRKILEHLGQRLARATSRERWSAALRVADRSAQRG